MADSNTTTYFIAGGAGFIGSHMVLQLLAEEPDCRVVVYDNFSSGQRAYLEPAAKDPRLRVVAADLKDAASLAKAMDGCQVVYHFASNPDIARAATEPGVDFWEGTYLTHQVLEAARAAGARRVLYASGSGVYGDAGRKRLAEDYPYKLPVSTYGASKLAGESLLCSYCHMFGLAGSSFRFANVVGPRQTHGVGFDFLRKLRANPKELEILGDGTQSKPYIDVTDVLSALRLVERRQTGGYQYYNVATPDAVTVKAIADLAVAALGLAGVRYRFTGGPRGWQGDVPVVRLDARKLRALGWRPRYSSAEAVRRSLQAMANAETDRRQA
ncbi:MAG: NAD-dependent epimerase/dehydratase family protein [candidate division FCPU426 bacterium]